VPREDGRQEADREARRANLVANLAREAGKKAVAERSAYKEMSSNSNIQECYITCLEPVA
jgi:hypothetical protein